MKVIISVIIVNLLISCLNAVHLAKVAKVLPCTFYESPDCWNVQAERYEDCFTCEIDGANLTTINEETHITSHNIKKIVKMVIFNGGFVDFLPMKAILGAFPRIDTIMLNNTRTGVINSKFFGNNSMQLQDFMFMNSIGQTKIEANAFKTAPNLLDIFFFRNDLKIHPQAFLHQKKLKDLSFVDGTIEHVDFTWFKDLQELLVLRLDSNKISKLNWAKFKKLSKLEELNMDDNIIESLDGSLFAGNPNLKTLSFRSNKIKDIKVDTFKNLKHLTKVNLENNLCIDKNFIDKALIKIEMDLAKCHQK